MEKGHFGEYSGNARHSRTPVTKHNVHAAERDDAAHIDYLKRDILWDDKHGHSDIDMTADEKHISKLSCVNPAVLIRNLNISSNVGVKCFVPNIRNKLSKK